MRTGLLLLGLALLAACTAVPPAAPGTASGAGAYFAKAPTYTATYNVTTLVNGKLIHSIMTDYMDLPTRMRMDTGNAGVDTATFVLPSGSYACTGYQGSWTCSKGQSTTPAAAAQTQQPGRAASGNWQSAPGRTIAGTSTACYTLTSGPMTMEYCFSPEGVPLLVNTTMTGYANEMVAVNYTLGVTDADFVLPATPAAAK